MQDPNRFLMGDSVPSAKFPTPGTTVTGRICEPPTVTQQTDFKTGTPKTWPSGDPMNQLVVTLQTEQRDPNNPDDDGRRRVYVKGRNLKPAVVNAVRAAGAKGLEIGGTLTVTYTGDGQAEGSADPPKLYQASYVSAAQAELGATQAPAAPAAQPAPLASVPGVTPEQLAAAAANPQLAALLAQLQGQQK